VSQKSIAVMTASLALRTRRRTEQGRVPGNRPADHHDELDSRVVNGTTCASNAPTDPSGMQDGCALLHCDPSTRFTSC
jgi:hypothetical protein